nr:venom polypeptide precursor [Doratifera vulnerans]
MLFKNIIILSIILPTIFAKCCFKKTIKFELNEGLDKDCSFFENAKLNPKRGSSDTSVTRCKVSVCGDGRRPREGNYCGIGKCNMLGCQCEGGCIKGKNVKEFIDLHGDKVKSVHQHKLDELMDQVFEGMQITT